MSPMKLDYRNQIHTQVKKNKIIKYQLYKVIAKKTKVMKQSYKLKRNIIKLKEQIVKK